MLGADADYRGVPVHGRHGAGAQPDRSSPSPATGGKLDLSGAFLARGSEHIDTTLVVDHAVPHCVSRELFKGVLDGRRARRVPGQGHRAPGRAEDRRQADGAGADAVAGRRVRLQAGTRDLRRRRRLRPRLDVRPSSTRICCSICRSRGIPEARGARPADRSRSSARRSRRSSTRTCARRWRAHGARAGCGSRLPATGT